MDITLPLLLKRAREQRGWTQKQAAKAFGVSQSMISYIERGTHDVPDDALPKMIEEYKLDRELVTELCLAEIDRVKNGDERAWLLALRNKDARTVRRMFTKHILA